MKKSDKKEYTLQSDFTVADNPPPGADGKAIEIIDYRAEHQIYFEAFNRAWIEEYFVMEPVDEYVVRNPEKAILEPGGAILMALYNGEVAGTVGLKKIDDRTFEFTKMAVDQNFRRKSIAEALSYASFEKAKELGAATVILYSNTNNAAAIKLYEKLGFEHVEVEQDVYKRANVKMVLPLDRVANTASY
jgi:ribosomal protein S18 acetylase RimI-like enzyme